MLCMSILKNGSLWLRRMTHGAGGWKGRCAATGAWERQRLRWRLRQQQEGTGRIKWLTSRRRRSP